MGNGKTGICGQWNVHSNIQLTKPNQDGVEHLLYVTT